jgi:F-type H+-transporting ATPase subunit a
MPDHSSWLTLVLVYMKDTLSENADQLGHTFLAKKEPGWASFEPLAAALLVVLILVLLSLKTRADVSKTEQAVVPDDRLTLRTFMEAFLGYFYDMAKSVMDAERAKRYFPVIGASALFVFFSNALALVPGMPVATSNLNITMGCALVVFVLFNLYGITAQGVGPYLKHLGGPVWWMFPVIFAIEVISLIVRPITLSVRLALNMSVDHLLLTIFLGWMAVLLPLPVMVLGCLIILIQTLVFALLTCIYIALATEHEAH